MVGKNIRELRMKKDFSLRGLAEKAKISKSTLSDIENEKTNPTVTTLEKIADALEVPLDYLTRKSMIENELYNYQVFFTVIERNKFVPSNICCDMTSYITKAVRFEFLDDAKRFMKDLNKERDFTLVRVKCEIEEVSDT